jgi:ABC-2 type transport system ATP-binding protein
MIANSSVEDFIRSSSQNYVRVRSPRAHDLASLLTNEGARVAAEADGALAVTGLDGQAIGDLALAQGIALHELSPQNASLEEAFMELTKDSVEYHASGVVGGQ